MFSRTENQELAANITAELFDIELPKPSAAGEPVIISTCLKTLPVDGGEEIVIARCTNWLQPYRYLNLPRPKLNVCVDGDEISVKVDVPVKGFVLYVEDVDGGSFGDNLLDLVPGDEQIVVAPGLNGRAATWKYYGME